MTAKTQRKAIYLVAESSYAETPRPADAGYLAVPVLSLGELEDGAAPIETSRFTGRTGMTPAVPGPGGASFNSTHEVVGFDAPVGDSASAPAEDRFDRLLSGIAGTAVTRNGATATHSGTSLTVASDLYDAGDLVYLVTAGGVGYWVPIAADGGAGSYTLAWDPGVTGTVARGVRQWADDDGNDSSATFNVCYDYDSAASNGQWYAAAGSRITSASMTLQADQQAQLSLNWQGDAKDPISAPSFSTGVNGDPAVQPTTPLRLACAYVDGVEVQTASISIDWGLEVQPRPSTCNANNRVDMVQMAATPTVTIQPLFDEALLALRRSQAQRSVLVQVGTGDQSFCLYCPVTQVSAASPTDRNGEQDISVTFSTKTTGSGARWLMARA